MFELVTKLKYYVCKMDDKKRCLHLNKKGQIESEIYLLIIESIVFVLFAVIVFSFIKGLEGNTTFDKNYYSRDIAILYDTMYGSPGRVVYIYPEDTSEYKMTIENNLVSIIKKGEDELEARKYWYADENIDKDYVKTSKTNQDQVKMVKYAKGEVQIYEQDDVLQA